MLLCCKKYNLFLNSTYRSKVLFIAKLTWSHTELTFTLLFTLTLKQRKRLRKFQQAVAVVSQDECVKEKCL